MNTHLKQAEKREEKREGKREEKREERREDRGGGRREEGEMFPPSILKCVLYIPYIQLGDSKGQSRNFSTSNIKNK